MNAQLKTAEMNAAEREVWLAERRKYMGASDAPAAMGMSRYRSPVEVALEKRRPRTSEEHQELETEQQRRGHMLEPVVAELYARQFISYKLLPTAHVVHPDIPWMAATPDRFIDGEPRLLECKTHSAWIADQYGDFGTDEVTDYEYVQVQHQMACTGAEVVDIAVLFAPEEAFGLLVRLIEDGVEAGTVANYAASFDFRVFHVARDDAFIADLIEAEKEFWARYVEGDEIPADIRRCYPRETVREASKSEDAIALDLKNAWLDLKRAERDYKPIRAAIEDAIGEDSGLDTRYGKITWKRSKDTESTATNWEAVAVGMLDATKDQAAYDRLMKEHTATTISEGSRRFVVPSIWKKDL